MRVTVKDNDVARALRVLKRKMQNEGLLRELRERQAYEKPSARRIRDRQEAEKRERRREAKRIEREGF